MSEAEASDLIPPVAELAPPQQHTQFTPTIAIKGGSVGFKTDVDSSAVTSGMARVSLCLSRRKIMPDQNVTVINRYHFSNI